MVFYLLMSAEFCNFEVIKLVTFTPKFHSVMSCQQFTCSLDVILVY